MFFESSNVPAAYVGIALSVVVLGLAITLNWRAPMAMAMAMAMAIAIVASFGVFHGYAHGAGVWWVLG